MDTFVSSHRMDDQGDPLHFPYLTILLPIGEKENAAHLRTLKEATERDIREIYGSEDHGVIKKLEEAIGSVDYGKGKKSVVISISPMFEKTIYLDMPLVENVFLDEPFEIRDLVASIYPASKYLMLVQSAGFFRIFLGEKDTLVQIKTSIPDHAEAYKNDIAERIENFSDIADRREVLLDKFILHIDRELETILHQYKLPVFVIGTEKMNGHFRKHTRNEKEIVDYIHGNYDDAGKTELLELIQPYLREIADIEKKEIAEKMEHAINAKKICFGIHDVWRNMINHRGDALLVERNYTYPKNGLGASENTHSKKDGPVAEFENDAVDVLIEKALVAGGMVRFVEPDVIPDNQHIALFTYY